MLGKGGLQLLQVSILARLLAPTDFGLMATVFAVVAFFQVFADLGVSSAVIHHQHISHNQLSSLYWLNVLVGSTLMLILIAISYGIGGILFHQPGIQRILALISGSILINAVGQQLRIMAEKALRFAVLAKIELAAALAGSAIAIGWAWYTPSVNALVAGVLVSALLQTCLLWLYVAGGWTPAPRLRIDEIRHFLKFGGYMMANNLVNSLNLQLDILIGARLFPAATLGSYSLPRTLSLTVAGMVNPVITRIGFPMMARAQSDAGFLKSVYLKTVRMTASINFPVYIGLAVFSSEIVQLVFGEQWIDSAPLLVLLAAWGMLRACANPVGSLLLAVGRADLSFQWNVALLFLVPPALLTGANWGIQGLAAAQAILTGALLIPTWYFLVRPCCGARAAEYLTTLLSPFLCALLAVALSYLVVSGLVQPLPRLIGAAFAAVPMYLIFSYLFNREWVIALAQLIFYRRR